MNHRLLNLIKVMRHQPSRLGVTAAFATAPLTLSGCGTLPAGGGARAEAKPDNVYKYPPSLPTELRRVALLPVADHLEQLDIGGWLPHIAAGGFRTAH